MPTCYAPVRRAPIPVLLQELCTRLACVKHAASVRSEPGSNSRLKPVAWRSNKKPDPEDRASLPSKIVSRSNYSKSHLCSKPRWGRTDSGTSYRLSKSGWPPCPAEWHPANQSRIASSLGLSTPHSDHFFFSTKFLSPASISIILRRALSFCAARPAPPTGLP